MGLADNKECRNCIPYLDSQVKPQPTQAGEGSQIEGLEVKSDLAAYTVTERVEPNSNTEFYRIPKLSVKLLGKERLPDKLASPYREGG